MDEVLNAGLGWMHELKKGQTFRILDIEGNQAVDTTFYDLENPEDHYGAGTDNRGTEKYLFDNGKYFKSRVRANRYLKSQQTRQADTILWAVLVHRKAIQSDMREKRDICTTARDSFMLQLADTTADIKKRDLARISTSL